MCANVLTPRAVAKSSWKYINTKPESNDKYLIELPATVKRAGRFCCEREARQRHQASEQVLHALLLWRIFSMSSNMPWMYKRIARPLGCALFLPSLIPRGKNGAPRPKRLPVLMRSEHLQRHRPMRDTPGQLFLTVLLMHLRALQWYKGGIRAMKGRVDPSSLCQPIFPWERTMVTSRNPEFFC